MCRTFVLIFLLFKNSLKNFEMPEFSNPNSQVYSKFQVLFQVYLFANLKHATHLFIFIYNFFNIKIEPIKMIKLFFDTRSCMGSIS